MIRKDQHAVADIRLIKRVIDRSDDLLINVLDRPDLVLHASLMSHLVRSFDVDIDKIKSVLCEGFHSSICLPGIVRVQTAVCPLHKDVVHSRACGDPLEQVYRRDHSSVHTVLLSEGCQRRPRSRAPEPRRVSRILSLSPAFHIHGMVLQDIIAFLHHLAEHRITGKIFPDPFRKDVVRRGQLHDPSVLLDQEMTVTRPHIE